MDNLDKNELEESFLVFRNVFPRCWWNLYQGCLEAGFDRGQSMALLMTHILSQNTGGIRPPDASGPKSDDPEC
jgi:hypothetical protein